MDLSETTLDQAIEAFENALQQAKAQNAELTDWQKAYLARTLSSISITWYDLAITYADKALTPDSEQSPDYPVQGDYSKFSVQFFERTANKIYQLARQIEDGS